MDSRFRGNDVIFERVSMGLRPIRGNENPLAILKYGHAIARPYNGAADVYATESNSATEMGWSLGTGLLAHASFVCARACAGSHRAGDRQRFAGRAPGQRPPYVPA